MYGMRIAGWAAAGVMVAGLSACGLVAGLGNFKDAPAAGGGGNGGTGSATDGGPGGGGGIACGNGKVEAGEECDGTAPAHAKCMACKVVCDQGFEDCNGSAADGCEAELATASQNCSACGHDCLGGACTDGLCAADTLATMQPSPQGIAVTADALYWANNSSGEIQKLSLQGGAPATLSSNLKQPIDLAVDDAYVYFTCTGDGTLNRVPIGGGTTEMLHSEPALQARWLAMDATDVYWVSWSGTTSKLHRLPKGGTVTTVPITQVMSYNSFTKDDAYLFFGTTNWKVYRTPFTLDPPTEILAAAGGQPRGMATDPTWLYFTNLNGTTGGLYKMVKFGGAPVSLVSGLGASNADLALRDGTLYVLAEGMGEIFALPTAGGPKKTLAKVTGGGSIAVDTKYVYWADAVIGSVYRVPR
jgi:hypothetical protein